MSNAYLLIAVILAAFSIEKGNLLAEILNKT